MLNLPDLSGKRVLVTGGAGFLGRHLLPRLLATSAKVRCLIRSQKSLSRLPDGVEAAYGDCCSLRQMQEAAAGCSMAIHMAAKLFGTNWQEYLSANYASANNLAQVAKDMEKVIFISSLAASGPSSIFPGRNETMPAEPVSAYGWSKLLAERVIASGLSPAASLVILRPPIIYGSGDLGLLPLFKSCKHGFGLSPGLRAFPVSIIHADDVAQAILLACAPSSNGLYHLSDGKRHTMEEFCRAIGRAQNKNRIIVLKPPLALMGTAAWLGAGASMLWNGARKMAGKKPASSPLWNPDKYRETSQKGWMADNGKISRELGFIPQISLEAGMDEAVAGYREAGLL